MSPSTIDMWLVTLQLLAVCGGVILIGCLSVKIVKNRGPADRAAGLPAASFSDTLIDQLVEQRFQKALARIPAPPERNSIRTGGAVRNGPRHCASARVPDKGAFPGSRTKGSPLEIRFRQAARLAARGVEPDIIRRRVDLPRCEIDLIARLNNKTAPLHWEEHGPLLAAIEAAG